MPDNMREVTDAPDFFEAYISTFEPLLAVHGLQALLAGAEESGLMSALRQPVAHEALRTSLPLEPEVADALVAVLVANGVAVETEGRLTLAPAWLALSAPDAYVELGHALRGSAVKATLLSRIAAGDTYWTMPSRDRVDFACSVSPNPFSPQLVMAFRASAETHPIRARIAQGGRMLELGCGVAGAILTLVQAFPDVRAVGVELADDLADEAERRADALGVADRFTVVRGDAATFRDAEGFDFAHWSQFFFPADSRRAAVASAFANLHSGGFVFCPQPFPFDAAEADPSGESARHVALEQLVLASWGVPRRTTQDLIDELTEGGFVDARYVAAPGDAFRVMADRP